MLKRMRPRRGGLCTGETLRRTTQSKALRGELVRTEANRALGIRAEAHPTESRITTRGLMTDTTSPWRTVLRTDALSKTTRRRTTLRRITLSKAHRG